jgi:DNA-directed RNA polymerase specialized sigma24 family protein
LGRRAGDARSPRHVDVDTVGLLELVRLGDDEAFDELVARHQRFAGRIARRVSPRHAGALATEAFRRVRAEIGRGEGPRDAFGPYLAATIRSAAIERARPNRQVDRADAGDNDAW